MRNWLLFILLACPLWVWAIEFDESTKHLSLGRSLQVFEDVQGTTTIADISSPALSGSFVEHRSAVFGAGYSRSAYWIRVDLTYQPKRESGKRRWLLEMSYPPLDHYDIYTVDEAGRYRLAQRMGDTLPFGSRPIRHSSYLYEMTFEPGETKRLYLRVASEGSVQAPLTLWSPLAFIEDQPARTYLTGIIYGVLLVMMLYNLLIFLSVRDLSYLYHIFYVGAFALYLVSINGTGSEYLWPDSPWWANTATPFLLGLAGVFGTQFARHFLQTRQHSQHIDRCLIALIGLAGLSIVASLTCDYAVAMRLATLLALVFIFAMFTAGIRAWFDGMRVARYFIIAWTIFLLGGLANILMVSGLLPYTFLTVYASQIGSALEVALLSLALADRIHAMREERARILEDSRHALERLNEELANSNRLKDEFLATVTHELRTPMNGVIGSLELFQTQPMSPEMAKYHESAHESARTMMRMVDDILALSELRAGKQVARRMPFSLHGLCDSLNRRFTARAQAKDLAFVVEVDPLLPDTFEGDAPKLAKALSYLLDNAFKFTHCGEVVLTVKAHPEASPDPQGQRLLIEVVDTGIGFTPEQSAQLYQRFHPLDGSRTRRYGGLGVGLALCRKLVLLMGGTLEHASTPGEGSRFSLAITLPLPSSMDRPMLMRRACLQTKRQPANCTVLLVENNPQDAVIIRGMLLRLGYRVCTACSGSEALDLLDQKTFDVVLLNCQMPVMDGFATCRALRALSGCENLPVLALSAHPYHGDRDHCLAAGMSDYLSKPVKLNELQSMLQDWLLCQPQMETF
ncbi:signal transduction histidine kinase [Pseudomonas duriflava]|uniref:histidine kinase n=1 Tax=Pseudomonas duriflava TaxID=459528 RepID=A0A562QBY6_9PSED|nr:hybrid sensor histidine kinase/response regulator [Pseudomonas duriflava]TWI54261.1 signal transduction histidine kinase [Pseudomonas duriflava]